MNGKPLAPEVEWLLARHVRSVGALDLLDLVQAQRHPWHVADVAAALRAPESWTEHELEAMRDGGLLARDAQGAYAYAPVTPRLAEAVDALTLALRTRRADVVRRIFEEPRADLAAFSDAFRLRRRAGRRR